MIIAKFGGSLIAPKNTINFIDSSYLAEISTIRNNIIGAKFFIHGGGNIGHNFIKEFGLSKLTYLQGRVKMQQLFTTIDQYILGTRLDYSELNFININTQGSYICGGDITTDLTISSGDDQFPQLINLTKSNIGYIFTDVDGVLDQKGQIIPSINKDTISIIQFWNTPNDVTGGMKSKIEKLIQHIDHPCTIWIANGKNIDNMKSLFNTGDGNGTCITIT